MSEAPVSKPPSVEVVGMSKHFGALTALDSVSIQFRPGTFHAILGENGAGKSTLVKCVMGYYRADAGEIRIEGTPHAITNPRHAHHLGLGMVYQHFTLVPNMTVAENLVLGEENLPAMIDWPQQYERLQAFQSTMPFRLDLERPVASLAAGEKQKLEILKQLFLNHRVLILDEPTSVLTPAEAKQVLGLMRQMSEQGRLSVVLITHKLREVEEFATEVTVLRAGKVAGGGLASELTHGDLVQLMIGRKEIGNAMRRRAATASASNLEIRGLTIRDDKGLLAVEDVSLRVQAGEIVGVAGVSGNGQRELVEVLAGQRQPESGEIFANGTRYNRTRQEMRRQRIHLLPEEPLRNGLVRSMSVSENLAFRNFDRTESTHLRWFVNRQALRRQALGLIQHYGIKTQGPDARIETLSGGNVQRTVLARELSEDVSVLIVQNPCVGLDLSAVAEMRNRIMAVRNAGAGVLLISEDFDEILELADRIVVMFEGRFVYETPRDEADVHTIGRHMASHVLSAAEQEGSPEPSEMTAP